jgi:ABC-type transport system involved in multi-copper enzyme maturation permease subunit
MLLDFPLLKRELTEAAYRRRTYALRCIVAGIMLLVLISNYQAISAGNGASLPMILGRGSDLVQALLYFALWTVYLLLPAMSCSAISSEREKQTLGLILISRVSPAGLVLEKFLGRLLPMMGLLSLTAPLLGIAYAMGGFGVEGILTSVLVLFVACLQVISAGIFWSSLMATSMQAFWCTYLTLLALILVPVVLYFQDLMPTGGLLFGLEGGETCFVFYIFMVYGAEALLGRVAMSGFLFSCLPPIGLSLAMIAVSGLAVSRWRMEAPLGAIGKAQGLDTAKWILMFPWRMLRSLFSQPQLRQPEADQSNSQDRKPKSLAGMRAVAWREMNRTPLARLPAQILVVFLIVTSLLWLAQPEYFIRPPDNVILVHFCLMLISALLMTSIGSRTFTSERERETMDLLLTTPLSTEEILRDKLAAASRIRTFLMLVFVGLMAVRLLSTDYENNRQPYAPDPAVYAVSSLLYCYLHLTFCTWISVMFSLILKTQMRAMIGSLLVILGVCFGTLMVLLILMTLFGIWDDGSIPNPALISPFFVYVSNELMEVQRLSRGIAPEITVSLNLLGYSAVVLGLQTVVRLKAGEWLGRKDDEIRQTGVPWLMDW